MHFKGSKFGAFLHFIEGVALTEDELPVVDVELFEFRRCFSDEVSSKLSEVNILLPDVLDDQKSCI